MRALLFVTTIMGNLLSAQAETKLSENELKGVLKADKQTYRLGEIIHFSFSVLNKSSDIALLVKILDGSECGFRQPQASLSVVDPDGKLLQIPVARCGNTSALQKSDFVWINSGEAVDLANKRLSVYSGFFKKAGKYTFKLTYSTANDNIQKWIGRSLTPNSVNQIQKECGPLFLQRKKITLHTKLELELLPEKI